MRWLVLAAVLGGCVTENGDFRPECYENPLMPACVYRPPPSPDLSSLPDMDTTGRDLRGWCAPNGWRCGDDADCCPSTNNGRVWASVCWGGVCKYGTCGGPCVAAGDCGASNPQCIRYGIDGYRLMCISLDDGNHCPLSL